MTSPCWHVRVTTNNCERSFCQSPPLRPDVVERAIAQGVLLVCQPYSEAAGNALVDFLCKEGLTARLAEGKCTERDTYQEDPEW